MQQLLGYENEGWCCQPWRDASEGLAGTPRAPPWMWLTDRVQTSGRPRQKALLPTGTWPVGMCPWRQVLLKLITAGALRVRSGLGAPTHSENLTSQLSSGAGGGGKDAGLSPQGWPALRVAELHSGAAGRQGGSWAPASAPAENKAEPLV